MVKVVAVEVLLVVTLVVIVMRVTNLLFIGR